MLGIDKAKPILRASIDGLNQGKFTEGHEKHLEQRAEPPSLRNDAVASLAMAGRIELPIDRPHEARGGACVLLRKLLACQQSSASP